MNKPAPKLKDPKWSPLFQDFIGKCLIKEPEERYSASQLLEHPFLANADSYREEFTQYLQTMAKVLNRNQMGSDNNKANNNPS